MVKIIWNEGNSKIVKKADTQKAGAFQIHPALVTTKAVYTFFKSDVYRL